MVERKQFPEGSGDAGSIGGDWVDFRRSTFHGPVVGKLVEHNHYEAPPSSASWPHQVGAIPPQAVCFQNRAEVARLAAALTGGSAALVRQGAPAGVIVGLGGVGKTQLAAHYARTAWQAGDLDVL